MASTQRPIFCLTLSLSLAIWTSANLVHGADRELATVYLNKPPRAVEAPEHLSRPESWPELAAPSRLLPGRPISPPSQLIRLPELVVISPVTVAAEGVQRPKGAPAERAESGRKRQRNRFLRVERQRILQAMNAQIELAQAEVESYRRVLQKYSAFTRFKFSDPLLVTIERTRLALLEAENRLRLLRAERSRYLRYGHF